MGRRKKEPEGIHREAIALAAGKLIARKGVDATTMDEIAKEAGYSKATLYVYFTNKEEIVGYLTLRSMKLLKDYLTEALTAQGTVKEKYKRICLALAGYQEQYPFYFTLALGEIKVDFEHGDYLPAEKETFVVGEQINEEIARFIRFGIETGEFPEDLPVLQTGFLFWSSLAGLIQMASAKRAYMKKAMNLTKEQFLDFGFDRLYRLIVWKEC